MKNSIGSVVMLLLVFFCSIDSKAALFEDNFDVPPSTISNWMTTGLWDFETLSGSDLGFHTNGDGPAFADNGQNIFNVGLTIETDVILRGDPSLENNAGMFFSYDPVSDAGYAAFVKVESGIGGGLYLEKFGSDGSVFIDLMPIPTITVNTTYTIQTAVSQTGVIDVYLYNEFGDALGSLMGNPLDPAFIGNRQTGLFALNEATFNNYSIETNAVPIPSAFFLLGSGLLGIAGIRRGKK